MSYPTVYTCHAAQNSCYYIFLGDSIEAEIPTKAFNIEKIWKILNMKGINWQKSVPKWAQNK